MTKDALLMIEIMFAIAIVDVQSHIIPRTRMQYQRISYHRQEFRSGFNV